MSILNIFPDDLSFLGISVHHLGEEYLGIRARKTPGEPHRGGKNRHRLS